MSAFVTLVGSLLLVPIKLFDQEFKSCKLNRVKLIIEEIEREEAVWREDLYSSDRKFAEYYNVQFPSGLRTFCFLSPWFLNICILCSYAT